MIDQDSDFALDEDKMGMTVTSGVVTITKHPATNYIGIKISGGLPCCPCVYVAEIADGSPADLDGTLSCGDELLAVNNKCARGRTQLEVAQMIRSYPQDVVLTYNKLHVDIGRGKNFDFVLKKVKHRLVERVSDATVDSLGVSRAVIVDDALVGRLRGLDDMELSYRHLMDHAVCVVRSFLALVQCLKEFAEVFAEIGVREPQPRARHALARFADQHRRMVGRGMETVEALLPVGQSFGTYLHKVIPDTRQTVRKYADVKFEYLAFHMMAEELQAEEKACRLADQRLYRMKTGNYEYRLVLRCRELARKRFYELRGDVLTKIELLENKHVHDLADQLHTFASQMAEYNSGIGLMLSGAGDHGGPHDEGPLFPIEMDLPSTAFQYESIG